MRYRLTTILLFGFLFAVLTLQPLLVQGVDTSIPHIDLQDVEPLDAAQLLGRTAMIPPAFATLHKKGATYASPKATTQFEITVRNYDRYPHRYWIHETLPPELQFVSAENGLTYHPETHELTWSGHITPGKLEYIIEPAALSLPYIDLGEYGLPNLCSALCDDITLTYTFGSQNHTASLFGSHQRQLSLSTNGVILGSQDSEAAATAHPRWLPNRDTPNFTIAGLWQDLDMTNAGRWHVAILQGLITGHDVFYAQWHDAPHKNNPNATSRFAIAIVLDGEGGLNGHLFYIYDLISHPEVLTKQGYTIGIEDHIGSRGTTHAYAPCCNESTTPQGFPPASNVVLHLKPHLLGENYHRTLTYTAVVNADVPETVVSTVTAISDSADPTANNVWSSHYLYVRAQQFLPIVQR